MKTITIKIIIVLFMFSTLTAKTETNIAKTETNIAKTETNIVKTEKNVINKKEYKKWQKIEIAVNNYHLKKSKRRLKRVSYLYKNFVENNSNSKYCKLPFKIISSKKKFYIEDNNNNVQIFFLPQVPERKKRRKNPSAKKS